MGLAKRDAAHHTYADYCRWSDDVRYELIDGVAYIMSPSAMAPAPNRRHQEILGGLHLQIAAALEGTPCRPYLAPFDVRLPRNNDANAADDQVDTVVQPDISIICERSRLDERGARGAPDWIIEVLSPSTASHDQIVKRRLYERAGVREYWLVHPVDLIVTIYVLAEGTYGMPAMHELKETTACTILPAIVIDWERVLREA